MKVPGMCNEPGCEKKSHATKGPCSMHYYRERRALEVRKRDPLKHVDGRRRDDIDYDDFWEFVKRHIIVDGNGVVLGVKAGLNLDWQGESK